MLQSRRLEDMVCIWTSLTRMIRTTDLDLQRLDLSNCRCPVECCRLGEDVLASCHYASTNWPKRIEIVGALGVGASQSGSHSGGAKPWARRPYLLRRARACAQETVETTSIASIASILKATHTFIRCSTIDRRAPRYSHVS